MILARITTKLVDELSDSPMEAMDKKLNKSSFDTPGFVLLSDVIVSIHNCTESRDAVAVTGVPTGAVPTGDVTREAQLRAQLRARTLRTQDDLAGTLGCSIDSPSTLYDSLTIMSSTRVPK